MSQSTSVKTRVVDVESIEVEDRSGNEILVVTDHTGQQYTNYADRYENVVEKRDGIVGERFIIRYSLNGDFVNFEGFKDHSIGEPAEDQIRTGSEERVENINRDSGRHDAARIVQGMLNAGLLGRNLGFEAGGEIDKDQVRTEIKEELSFWTEHCAEHSRTGEFP